MKRFLVFVLAGAMAMEAAAAPAITAVSGSGTQGATLTVSGTNLPTKSRSKLLWWADGQDGTLGPNTSFSASSSFNATEHMTTVTDSNRRWGAGCFRSNVDYTSATRAADVRMDISPSYGSKYFVSWWEKSDINYLVGGLSQNWKFGLRVWFDINGTKYPDTIMPSVSVNQTASDIRISQEFPTTVFGYMGSSYGFPTTTWRRITALYQMPSALAAADGSITVYKNATTVKTLTGLQMNDAGHPNLPYQIFVQHVIANANWPSGSNWWSADYAIDDSLGRYDVCDNATYASATHCETQPYTAASATGATLNLHLGTFTSVSGLYLFVFDNSNVLSAGFSLAGLTGAPPPGITSINPANGPAAGSTTVTLTGSNLVATPAVKVCGVDATGESFSSATSMTFVTPAGTAGTTCDVLVTNPDAQSATLTNGFSYDAIPASVTGLLPWIKP